MVAILSVRYWCGDSYSIFGCGNCGCWEGDIQVASVSRVGWGREAFGEDITRVGVCSYSPNVYFACQVILVDSMMSDVDASTVLVHRRLGCNVFGGLVVCI